VVGRDLGGYVEEAKRTVAERVQLPPGYTLLWRGSSSISSAPRNAKSRRALTC